MLWTHLGNSNACQATCPEMAEVRWRQLGPAALNFPPTLVARDGTLRRLNHQTKSRSRWTRPSRALRLTEERWFFGESGRAAGVGRQGRRYLPCLLEATHSTPKLGSLLLPFALQPTTTTTTAYMQHGAIPLWFTVASCRSTSPIFYIRLCQSRGISRKPSFSHFNLYSQSFF
jgi:hypothetical protein